ncbi:uncharacterized protein LOC127123495 [Lathyrus oleraceus]|uniref:uncharacterized protein LOC127123495 n=1 Tax=Pisum sativum TaxID=3888 RepID=UPI0021D29B09|nr:uncharacterized protein LOC127123495 [Pisum sativum]
MHITLISKNKEKFIDGSLVKPPVSDPLYTPWIRCNTIVLAWIQRSIFDSIAKLVLWIDSAVGVWQNLQLRFSHGYIFRILDIQEDIYKLRQGTLDVSNYFTQLKVLWDELENYMHILACSYAIPYFCGAIASTKKYCMHDQVIRFLKGLNEKFTHSKSQIMMMSPLPHIDKAFSLLIQQEQELNNFAYVMAKAYANIEEPITVACQAKAHYGNSNGKPRNNAFRGKNQGFVGPRCQNHICIHCGRTNHIMETCFLKHDYPKPQSHTINPQPTSAINVISDSS